MSWFIRGYSRLLSKYKYGAQMVTAGVLWAGGDLISQRLEFRVHCKDMRQELVDNLVSKGAKLEAVLGKSKNDTLSTQKTTEHADETRLSASQIEEINSLLSQEKFKVDLKRLSIMTGFGFLVAGPAFTIWYNFLEKNAVRYLKRVYPKVFSTDWRIAGAKLAIDMTIFDLPYLTFFFVSTKLLEGHSFDDAMETLKRDLRDTYFLDLLVWGPVQLANFRYIPLVFQPVIVNSVNLGWNAYLSMVQHKPIEKGELENDLARIH